MKRCPQCSREYDNSMMFCLDDGMELLYGPASNEEPDTAILSGTIASIDAGTQQVSYAGENFDARDGDRISRRNSIVAGIVGIILVTSLGIGSYVFYGRAGTNQIDSIAVMPFVNESGNGDLEYLSDGMTETLIRSLLQLPNLNVKSRSSVFRYKGKDADAKTVGKELGVKAVLNGRIVQRGDQLKLDLELINAENENVIWTDEYDRKSSDLVSLQNEIARDVSGQLRLKLNGADQQKLTKTYTTDAEAYRLYLQGRYFWNKRTASEVAKGIPYFQQAVDRDPNFALGYVGLADSDEDRERALKKEYIHRALQIDDQLAEAHASLGYQYMLDYDWVASEKELRRAMEIDPKYPQSYAWNGARLMMIGKYDEALASIQWGLDLDPTSNGINFYKGTCLGVAGRRDEAIQQFKKTIEMDPRFPWSHGGLSRIYRLNGDFPLAAEERAIAFELDERPEVAQLARGVRESFEKGGWPAEEQFMQQNRPNNPDGGSKEDQIARLTALAERGNFWLFLIKTDPIYDPLRDDTRFQALVKKFDAPQ